MTKSDLGEKFENFETDQYKFEVEPVVKRTIGNSTEYFRIDNYEDSEELESELEELGFDFTSIEEDIGYMISIESKSDQEPQFRELEIYRDENSITEIVELMSDNQKVLRDIIEKKEESNDLDYIEEVNRTEGGLTVYDKDNPAGYVIAEEGSFVDLNKKV